MKRFILSLSLLVITLAVFSIPAKPGQWKTLKLADGTEVRALLAGDEHVHFWVAENGMRYVMTAEDTYEPISREAIAEKAMARRAKLNKSISKRLNSPLKASMGERTHYVGQKKGIVILAYFTDVSFKSGNNQAKFNRVLNEAGYNEGNFKGSVADYFKDQSAGQFELTFDVVGPYKMKNSRAYYGQNDSQGNDLRPEDMIIEACKQADAEVNFADYDWDGDGEVDQVFVVYAGKGEADGGGSSTIWPHMYTLSEAGKEELILDNVKIDTYACSSELSGSSIAGIGTFCHEFSHCMGFPDFYDTSYSGWFGMGDFDLMCSGSYNGDGFRPCNYTAHEKMMCGWQEPIVLGSENVSVTNMQPATNHGDTYIIYNDAHPDEYYMLENRQKTGWDTSYPTKGLMITHVDFDKQIWMENNPNTKITAADARQYDIKVNDHQRMTIFHADNDDDSKYWDSYYGYYTRTTTSSDLYPYSKNDSLTPTSIPAATLYNANSKGKKFMEGRIKNIKQNSNGTISFDYVIKEESGDDPVDPDPVDPDPIDPDPVDPVNPEGALFYESFDQCSGSGGNDGKWGGTIATATFIADNEGWVADKSYGAKKCARFGTSETAGVATTPSFTIDGEVELTFNAAPWVSNKDGVNLRLSVTGNATVSPASFTLVKSQWNSCKATIKGMGAISLTFTPDLRFFLDEIVVKPTTATGIMDSIVRFNAKQSKNAIYTLDGRYMGTDTSVLRPGIYLIGGKKVVR